MLTLMCITMDSTVHLMGSKESKDVHFDVFYNTLYNLHSIESKESKESKEAPFGILYNSILLMAITFLIMIRFSIALHRWNRINVLYSFLAVFCIFRLFRPKCIYCTV